MADLHGKIADQFGINDALPCADTKLLVPLKRSSEYRTLRPRIADMLPLDHWQEEGLHFFVFALRPENGSENGVAEASVSAEPPVAVFAMHPEESAPVSAVVVTPSASGEEAQVLDLRKPENAYTAPYVPAAPLDVLPPTITIQSDAGRSATQDQRVELTLETALPPTSGTDTYQWQVQNGAGWEALPGQTSPTLSLAQAEITALAGEVWEEAVTIRSLPFTARVHQAQVRLHLTRSRDGQTIGERDSNALAVAVAQAIHP